MEKDFYLYRRGAVYYARIRDQKTGTYLSARSTGKKNQRDAERVASDWMASGAIPSKETKKKAKSIRDSLDLSAILKALRGIELSPADADRIGKVLVARGLFVSYAVSGQAGAKLLEEYLEAFWDYEKGPYARERLADGKRVSKEHFAHSLGRARGYWIPYFKGRRIAEITDKDLRDFKTSLASPTKKLTAATRNRILLVGTAALRFAYRSKQIDIDPTLGLGMISGQSKKRGVLTMEEAARLFRLEWIDERAKVASLVAATTGLRVSELRALTPADILTGGIRVARAYTDADGLKSSTKTGYERIVPAVPGALEAMKGLAKINPNGPGYVFWDPLDHTKPTSYSILRGGLYSALDQLKTGTATPSQKEKAEAREYWSRRGVTFHSWRHFYSARMADRLDARTVMRATGHATQAVFEAYADHEAGDEKDKLRNAAVEAFEELTPSPEEEA